MKIVNKIIESARLRVIKFFALIIKDDETYLKVFFFLRMGKRLNIDNPTTFSEKLQWLKLHNRKSVMTRMVDKIQAKEYVLPIIGSEYIIPTIASYDSFNEIEWNKLPSQFVLKCTHDSGGVIVCSDIKKLDIKRAEKVITESLNKSYYSVNREWPYKNVKPRIIIEKLIGDGTSDLKDYKFFCFGGEPKYCQVIGGRKKKMVIDFFDSQWNHQDFHEPKKYEFAEVTPTKPINFAKMLDLASKLSAGFPFIRVDFYEVDGRVYFGELTFYPTSGAGGFDPEAWDAKMGRLINLNIKNYEQE